MCGETKTRFSVEGLKFYSYEVGIGSRFSLTGTLLAEALTAKSREPKRLLTLFTAFNLKI